MTPRDKPMAGPRLRRAAARTGWILCLGTCGCLVHPPGPDARPTVAAGASYNTSWPETNAAVSLPQPWWLGFRDPQLDALMVEALESNLGLQQLAARIDQAQAALRQSGSRLFPALDLAADYQSQWRDFDEGRSSERKESSSIGALLSWEADVWGRLRMARQARAYASQAAGEDWRGGRLLLSASVAEVYFEILEQRQQLAVLEEQLRANQTLLDLTKLRFGQGQSSIVDVLQQQEQLESTRAIVPGVIARLKTFEYTLDVLLGRAPGSAGRGTWDPAAKADPDPLPPLGVPSELLLRRPDLLAAQARVASVDREVGEAVADRLPRLVLGGALGATGTPGVDTLVGSVVASLIGPLFDAGERKAEVTRRRALLREFLAAYTGQFLEAIAQVESALTQLGQQEARVRLLEDELTTARRLLTETRNRYAQGLTDYLPVLAAVVTEQNLQRDLVNSRREWLSFRVAVHRALGGPMEDGWATGESSHGTTLHNDERFAGRTNAGN